MAKDRSEKAVADSDPSFIRKFFTVNRKLVIDKVDRDFVTTNIPGAAKREAEVIRSLIFLGLVDSEGKPTEKLERLRAVGDEFKKNLRAVVESAYGELLKGDNVKTVNRENLINYFMRSCGLNQRRAEIAANLLVALCKDCGLELPSVKIAPAASKPLAKAGKREPPVQRKPKVGTQARRALREALPIQITLSLAVDQNTPPQILDRILKVLEKALGIEETNGD